MLPDRKDEKLMGKVRKGVKYDDILTGEGHYNATHDKSEYEVKYPDGSTEQMVDKILTGNVLSQVYFEGHHYQVLTEVTYHKRDHSAITRVNGFIRYSNGSLHRKRKTRI